MARTLIGSMDTPFDPAAYHDEYQVKLRKLLEDKIANREITAPAEEKKSNIIDLMEALQKSVENAKAEQPAAKRGRPRKTG